MTEFHNQFDQQQIDLARVKQLRRQNEPTWSVEAEKQLTLFLLGLPTAPGYSFEVIAGKPIAIDPKTQDDYAGAFRRRNTARRIKLARQAKTLAARTLKNTAVAC